MSSVQDIKVDITALNPEENQCPVILNFNIPSSVVEDNVPQSFDYVLDNIATYVGHHFLHDAVLFQLTASYYLVNTKTGDTRLWTGSFFPAGNHSASLSGPFFQAFRSPQSFVERIKEFSLPQNIVTCLKWGGEDSDWTFDSIASIIASVQVKLSQDNVFIGNNELLNNRRGHNRRIVTKFFPF